MKSSIEQTQEQLNENYESNILKIDAYFNEIKKGIQDRELCIKNHLAELHDIEQQRLILKMDSLHETQIELDKFDAFEYITESEVQMLGQTRIVEGMEQSLLIAKE